jgi:uncharacterized protein (DUF111 family)
MAVSTIGYGAGTTDLEAQPNVLRLMVGASAAKQEGNYDEEIRVIEANLDDLNPQVYGYFLERALAAGALDVFTTPIQMKKNRPGTLLTVLCNPADESKFQDLFFAETTTLGVRSHTTQRRCLPREWESVSTRYGEVRMKLARVNGRVVQISPEYEDCRKLAEAKSVPLQHVMQEALHSWRESQK